MIEDDFDEYEDEEFFEEDFNEFDDEPDEFYDDFDDLGDVDDELDDEFGRNQSDDIDERPDSTSYEDLADEELEE